MADNAPRLNAHGKPLISAWLSPLGQAEHHDVRNPIGLRGTESDTYTVRDVFVPEAVFSIRGYQEDRQTSRPF